MISENINLLGANPPDSCSIEDNKQNHRLELFKPPHYFNFSCNAYCGLQLKADFQCNIPPYGCIQVLNISVSGVGGCQQSDIWT